MDSAGTIFKGGVLVRSGLIVATWKGPKVPDGIVVNDAVTVDLGQNALIFPGLINLHDHPTFDILPTWPTPSSHAQPALGRPRGNEPYANRYQWNAMGVLDFPSAEYLRLVENPSGLLNLNIGLGKSSEVVKFSEIRALLGGETASQGSPKDPATNNILIRNVGQLTFGRNQIESRIDPIFRFGVGFKDSVLLADLVARMANGSVDAWIVHLAEGVRDAQRRKGDKFSSRGEFSTLMSKHLLTDATVIVHGTALEPQDFATMHAAPSTPHGPGGAPGAKLVWSPLSNLLLYGQTTLVYHALQAGVLVSLGTDWSPSGSRTLLDELKIADIALRDPRILGADRDLVPAFATTGKSHDGVEAAERALDEQLVRMVTINPAKTVRWDHEVGSIEVGKVADLLVITKPGPPSQAGLPDSPFRNLIDATERDVRLVMVGGEPLAGDVALMQTFKPGDYEVVSSPSGGFDKAIDVTKPGVSKGTETFAAIRDTLSAGLLAMGGDDPPPGGGTAPNTNTYTYLKDRIPVPGGGSWTDSAFRDSAVVRFGVDSNNRLNIEAIVLPPLFIEDDDFYFHTLEADTLPNGFIADPTPPFGLYATHFNQVVPAGNPFAAASYRLRYYGGGANPSAAPQSATPRTAHPGGVLSASVSPNPVTPVSVLTFATALRGHARVALFDARGRRVRNLLDEPDLAAGTHRLRLDGLDQRGKTLGPGIYFYRVDLGHEAAGGRVLIFR